MPTVPMRGPLRRNAMNQQGALYDFLFNLKEYINTLIPSAGLSLEAGAAPTLPTSTVACGTALTFVAATHGGRRVLLDTATGSTLTLPAATGSQLEIEVAVSVLATSNSHIIKVANASDIMVGFVANQDTDTGNAFAGFNTTTTSDTITLNRGTTGSVTIGERFKLTDVKANVWMVEGYTTSTGAPATPFSATV